MAAAAIIMAILGCGDAGTSCEAVGVAPARYESVSACIAAQDEVLAAADVMFPVVTAECRAENGARPAALSPKADRPAEPARAPRIRIATRG